MMCLAVWTKYRSVMDVLTYRQTDGHVTTIKHSPLSTHIASLRRIGLKVELLICFDPSLTSN